MIQGLSIYLGLVACASAAGPIGWLVLIVVTLLFFGRR
jgi:MYXO-CTERM domain-containing protein